MAIRSFADGESEKLAAGLVSRKLPPEIQRTASRKLRLLRQARSLGDLRATPGNRVEALRGDRAGMQSIHINDQWRLCFRWREGDAYDVEIVDYRH